MKKILVAVYAKISGSVISDVERAFSKAVFTQIANYFENGAYGIIFDLPDAPCYKSFGDSEIISVAERCYGALPLKYRKSFFVIVRARRYNVKKGKTSAFCCDGGAIGALKQLLSEKTEHTLMLGEIPKDYDFVYFSGSNGMIEAGGIAALLNAVGTEKNIFPFIKTGERCDIAVGKRGKGRFSLLEGLYRRDAMSQLYRGEQGSELSIAGAKKGEELRLSGYLNNVFVLNTPSFTEAENKKVTIKPKKDYPRIAYRVAVAISRNFMKIAENECESVKNSEDAAYTLVALIAMRMFGFLGERELKVCSEILLDTIEERLCIETEKNDLGRLAFLLTVSVGAYSMLSVSKSSFAMLKLCSQKLLERVFFKISLKNEINNDVFLIMCHVCAVPDVRKKNVMPRLMSSMLSENIEELLKIDVKCFDDKEMALCVLARAVNLCFDVNFKAFLFSVPVFRAKSSFLERMSEEESRKMTSRNETDRKEAQGVTEVFFSQRGMSAVKERFFKSGSDLSLIPYAAYLEKLVGGYPARKNIVKICYLSGYNSLLLQNILKSSLLIPDVSVCVVFDNRYAFDKAVNEIKAWNAVYRKSQIVLCEDIGKSEEIKRGAAFIRRLYPDTTLSQLMEEAIKRSRFAANVKSVPSVFSHCLFGGGELKKGFCTFLPNGERVTYGEFVRNPFTEIKSVNVTFVPRLRVKLMKVTFSDEKYRNGSEIFILLGDGEVLSSGEERELGGGDRITVLKTDTGDGILFAVQVFRNQREKTFLSEVMKENGFFERCLDLIQSENKILTHHFEIIRDSLGCKENDKTKIPFTSYVGVGKLPHSFFGKLIHLSRVGGISGIQLAVAAKRYAEECHDCGLFKIRIPIGVMREKGAAAERYVNGVSVGSGENGGSGRGGENRENGVSVGQGYSVGNGGSGGSGENGRSGENGGGEGQSYSVGNGGSGGSGENGRSEQNGKGCKKNGEGSKSEFYTDEKMSLKRFEREYRYPFYIHCLDRIKKAEESLSGKLGSDVSSTASELRELRAFFENIESSLRDG